MNKLSQKIINEWHTEEMTEQEQADFVAQIGRVLYQALLVRSLDILSEVEEAQLDLLLGRDETSVEDVLVFLEKKIPTFDMLLREEIENLKKDVFV